MGSDGERGLMVMVNSGGDRGGNDGEQWCYHDAERGGEGEQWW